MDINEDKRKVAMLFHFGGDYIRDIIDNVVPKREGYDATVEYLNKHLNPKTNDTFEIYRVQDSDETVQQFCNRLRSIASRFNFANDDKQTKTQLILGTILKNYANSALLIRQHLSKRLLSEEN